MAHEPDGYSWGKETEIVTTRRQLMAKKGPR